jgi:hypothetical protein
MLKSGKSIPAYIFIFLPIVIYLVYSSSNSVNYFFADDFHLLKTVLWIQDVDGLFEKLGILMKQHNEHRILFPRLLTLADYKIEGAINWRTLVMIGNLLWVGNLWFFWKGFKSFNLPGWMFIAVPFLFLQPQYTDNVIWAISILQQSVIIFWFSLLTYLCSRNRFSWALLVAVIATFTHGNGIFSFLIGIILAMVDRRWRTAAIWAGVWIVVGLIYFWGYEKGQSADFGRSLSDPLRLIMSFFGFFGAVTTIRMRNVGYAVLLGAILVTILAIYLLPKLRPVLKSGDHLTVFDKMLLGNVLFLGITGALVCVSRSWGGIESVLAPRYLHYSPYVICWVYIVLLSFLNLPVKKMAAGLFILFGVTFNALSYFHYNQDIQFQKNWLIVDESNWIHHGKMLNYAATFNVNIRETYHRVIREGICSSENHFPAISQTDALPEVALNLSFFHHITNDMDASGVYPRRFQHIVNNTVEGKTYLFLQPATGQGYWLPTRIPHSGIMEFFRSGRLSKAGFEAEFRTENLPAATYRIGMLNDNKFSWTSQTLDLRSN